MKFTTEEIQQLVQGQPLCRFPLPRPEAMIEDFYRTVAAAICAETATKDRTEWNHYGSGYASFIDAWFYHPDGRCRRAREGEHHAGIFVLLSRLSPFYVLGQGEKAWHAKGGSSYLPAMEAIDQIEDSELQHTASLIEPVLGRHGLQRLRREALEELLPSEIHVPTILVNPPFHVFDALFHWED